jgi:hypothetical protein
MYAIQNAGTPFSPKRRYATVTIAMSAANRTADRQ